MSEIGWKGCRFDRCRRKIHEGQGQVALVGTSNKYARNYIVARRLVGGDPDPH